MRREPGPGPAGRGQAASGLAASNWRDVKTAEAGTSAVEERVVRGERGRISP